MADKQISEQIEDIIVDCYDEYEQASAWEIAFQDGVATPFPASLLGTPVEVQGFQLGDDNAVQCLALREKQKRWIGVLDLDEDVLPEDMKHVLMLYQAWLDGDY